MRYVYPISYHEINISHMKWMKNRGCIIYPITYRIPSLTKHILKVIYIYIYI